MSPRRSRMRRTAVILALVAGAPSLLAGADPVRESSLVEKVSKRLVQLDVTILGPREVAATLTAADFEIEIAGREIPAFSADPACPPPEAAPRGEGLPPALRPPTFLLYFDEAHLTPDGRTRSIGLAREVLEPLLRGGGGAILVSGAAQIKHYAGPTSDVAALIDGLDRLERDAAQVQTTAIWEESREQEIASELDRINVTTDPKRLEVTTPSGGEPAPTLSQPVKVETAMMLDQQKKTLLRRLRGFQDEELSTARRGAERLGLALDRLAPASPPRIALYFGDTLRRNAGEHYFTVLRSSPAGRWLYQGDDLVEARAARNPFGVEHYFDELLALAATRGVRLYTVQAQGFTLGNDRVRDAQSTLVSLARETGGGAFLNGAPAGAIVERIASDTACTYLLSFDGSAFPEDRPLPVTVRVKREGLKVNARGMLAVESRGSRMRHERISALYGLGSRRADLPLRSALIPLGYQKGKFSALAQVAARELPVPGGEWVLSYTLVHDGEIEQEETDRMGAGPSAGVLAFEREIEIEPGDYALVGVAQETSSELTASDVRVESWPDPRKQGVIVTPISALQPAQGAFRRKDASRATGNVALAIDEPVRVDAPLALVAVACGTPKENQVLRVERRIEGGAAIVGFQPILLEPLRDACVQIRDLIPAAKLGEGYFRYEIVVSREDEVLARRERILKCTR